MKYTNKIPTVTGWYWVRDKTLPTLRDQIREVRVSERQKVLMPVGPVWDDRAVFSNYLLFAGPIPKAENPDETT
jgi:hypothetical protein